MPSYPVDEILPQLKETFLRSRFVVFHAPPGAGKTTRVPLALLDVIPPGNGRIVVLEPRRIAAVSAARWMAHILGEQVGETVGYSIRFESKLSAKTRIEVVTEGILTRRIQADPGLDGTEMVVFDEFHERSLHADLALALCLDICNSLRKDLKILVMSATLDCAPIAALLGGAPIISSHGRTFPVEERYIDQKNGRHITERVSDAVITAFGETSGDILVFLPGAGEIRACAGALRPIEDHGIEVHPLYGDLPFEEQERAILPSVNRKVVLATNIAETSLTIEGVGAVIDSGLTRRLSHDPSTGMNRLITVAVSKASAEQRKGRAGRLGPGVCYRLYGRHTFQSLVPFASPEILVSDLSSLVLDLAVWGVREPSELSWLDMPPAPAWETALRLLTDLDAVDPSGSSTSIGKAMARLPLHPRLARLVLKAEELGCSGLGVDLSALLSERDIIRRSTSELAVRRIHPREPDIAERLEILYSWRQGRKENPSADPWAVRAVDRIARQLLRLLREGRHASPVDADASETISRLLLCAFPDRIAQLRGDLGGRFVLSGGRCLKVPQTSVLARSPFIVAVAADAGEGSDGVVHVASPLSEELVRRDCGGRLENLRLVQWDRKDKRIIGTLEERLGAVVLSARLFNPSDGEAGPLLCEAVRSDPGMLSFSKEAMQFRGRVGLMRRTFPEEPWPDLSDGRLMAAPEEWLLPWLSGLRSAKDVAGLNLLPPLQACISREQARLLDKRAPTAIVVPSGHSIPLDYAAGDVPVLAVKLQEMFGLADTPEIAEGRARVLLHLLSPARRPVQITQDLKGFWNEGYRQVKKELKGRYPKHPWPEDPWSAAPTRRTKARSR